MSMWNEKGKKSSLLGVLLIACVLTLSVLSLTSCRQVIFLVPIEETDENTSTAASPYIPEDSAELQDILDMRTKNPIYIEVPASAEIDLQEAEPLTVPYGQDVRMVVNGSISLGNGSPGRTGRAIDGNDYDLVQVNGGWIPDTDMTLITVEDGAKLTLSGSGRIGGTIKDNPSRNLINVKKGGELTINGDITFVAFPYGTDSEIKNSTIYSDGILTINGGNMFSTYRTIFSDQNSTLTIKKGVFASVASNKLKTGYAYAVTGSGTSYINGGTYYGLQGALAQTGGNGEIKDATTKVSTEIFKDIASVDASVAKELAAFYDLNVKTKGHTHETISEGEAFHGLYIAGEDNTVDKIVVSGGSYYTDGAPGYGIYVGNSKDGGLGYPATVLITGGVFHSEKNKAAYCAVAGEGGYGEGFLQISGGRFKGKDASSIGIRDQDLAAGYTVSDTADSDGYYAVVEADI